MPVWDSALLEKWLEALNLKDWNLSEPSFVCSLHFSPDCFIGGHLRDDAVPTADVDQQLQETDQIPIQSDYSLQQELVKHEPMEGDGIDANIIEKLNEVCRICGGEFENSELHSIFDDEYKILEKITECLPIIIQETDILPLQICTTCMNEVNISHQLITKAVNTEIALLRYISSTEDEDDDIEENLESTPDHNEETVLALYGPVTCDICGLQFVDMADLDHHVKLEKQRTVVKHSTDCIVNKVCSLCGKVFTCEEDYQEHKLDGLHNCDKCGKVFLTPCDFNRHIIHQCSDEFACPHCYLTFPSSETLSCHIMEHESEQQQQQEQPFTEYCRRCGDMFLNNYDMFQHTCGARNKRNHQISKLADVPKENEAKYNCEICGRYYKRLSNLVKHCSSHKSAAGSLYKCPVIQCDKSFEKPSMLTSHVDKVHNMGEVWVCRYCGKSMTTKLSLNIHERIHMGIKPYVCEWCGVEFRSKANLSQHQAKHTGIRRHSCPVCGKMFSRKAFVTTHLRVHTGERPYFCDICDQRFTQIGDMRRHRRRHIATDQNGNPVGTRTLHKRGIIPQANTLSNINMAADSAPAVLIFHQNDVQAINQSQSYAVEQTTAADIPSYEIHGVLVQQ